MRSPITANNMYGHAMSQLLPISDFKWANFNDVAENDDDMARKSEFIQNLPDDSEFGYIFEVDLHYPKRLHDLHNDFPFCPEKKQLPQQAFDILGERASKFPKLLLTLFDKEKYVIHYKMLKLALKHGIVLKKVHRILKFKQSSWLKSYIDLNTQLRQKATNNFEKTFYKLVINIY